MKKQDIETIQKYVDEIKQISDKLDYNTSSAINQRLVKVTPLLKSELDRVDNNKIEMDCPQIIIIKSNDVINRKENKSITDYMNSKLKELVINEFKIIDFGIVPNGEEIYAFIKYTS